FAELAEEPRRVELRRGLVRLRRSERKREVRASHERPGPYPLGVESDRREAVDPPLGLLARHELSGRIPKERRHVVLGLADVGLGVDRDPLIALTQDVVLMEVAVNEGPVV